MNWFQSWGNGIQDLFSGAPANDAFGGYWNGLMGKGGYDNWVDGPSGGGTATTGGGGGLPLLSQTPGYAAAQDIALSKAPTPWSNLASLQQDQLKNEAIDNATATNANSVAGADANLAATGGLSSGARQRIAEGGDKSLMGLIQNANQTSMNNKMNIATTDAQMKQGALNNFNALTGQDIANQDQAWAAANTSNAISNTPTSKCFITTAMCDHFGFADDCHEMQIMRSFRDNYVAKHPEIRHQVAKYYYLAQKWDADLRKITDERFWRYIRGQIALAVIMADGKHGMAPDFTADKRSDRGWQAYLIYKRMVHRVGWEIKKRRILAALALPCAAIKSLLLTPYKQKRIIEVKNG